MKRQLRDRRDAAAERHDSALARFPTRKGAAFAAEIRAVIAELEAVATQADGPDSDPVEVAKTYRWLGDAFFDLSLGKDEELLTRGSLAYQRSDELLADADAPVEKAKLDFNYGNTLRGLSGGSDVGLLEAAQTRYESAARTFRSNHLPDLTATVDQQLRTIDPQLRLARKQAGMQRGYDRLQELQERLKTANAVEREAIARELRDLKRSRGRGDPEEALTEALDGIREQYEERPERFDDSAREELQSLNDQIGRFRSLLEEVKEAPGSTSGQTKLDPSDQSIATALVARLEKEVAEGTVSSDRAGRLREVFKRITDVMAQGGDDLESMQARTHMMRGLMQQVVDMGMTPSWSSPDPEPGSRASRAVAILRPLKRYLLAEKGRGMLPSEETSAGTELLERLFELEARIRSVAQDDRALADAEGESWRVALAVQEHARRYHVMLANPIFATAPTRAAPRSVFVSGGDELVAAARRLERREGLQLFERAHRGPLARERWNQLCSASVAVFDIGVNEGAERAQLCYELGLALALGKPCVVAARRRQPLPFNISLQPISLVGDEHADADTLIEGIEQALGSIVWGGGEAGLGRGAGETLAWLDGRIGDRLSDGPLKIAMDVARQASDDATSFRRALNDVLGMLGADAPMALLPAWPPAYPSPSAKPNLFHVMPFRPRWAKPTRDLAEAVCNANGWTYTRGDEAEEQRVIRGIWTEISRSSAVLIDITGHNPNVAIELGLTHALGRPYRIVAQGNPERHSFASLEKVQIHRYGRGPSYRGFQEAVGELIEAAAAKVAST